MRLGYKKFDSTLFRMVILLTVHLMEDRENGIWWCDDPVVVAIFFFYNINAGRRE